MKRDLTALTPSLSGLHAANLDESQQSSSAKYPFFFVCSFCYSGSRLNPKYIPIKPEE